MTLQQHALSRALADARAYQLALYAAMDALHEAHDREQRLRETICAMREERQRSARVWFPDAAVKEAGE